MSTRGHECRAYTLTVIQFKAFSVVLIHFYSYIFGAIGVERWDQQSAGLSGGGASRTSVRDPKSPGQEIRSQDHRPQIM